MFRKILASAASVMVAASAVTALGTSANADPAYLRIISVDDSSKVIADAGNRRVELQVWNGDLNQKWERINRKGEYYQYRNARSGGCLAVPNSSTKDIDLITYKCEVTFDDQFWKRIQASKGRELENLSTRKCVAYRNLVAGSAIKQQECGDDSNEEWYFDAL
ncbi:RICIN domain-containing protein [Actinosynnema sp. CS-041913]|uniref:RICIN domain-containing protein n=1 Tax=Actinosynnema sp. CS-041913 TaxID=3239917 RepID=UPI003D922614